VDFTKVALTKLAGVGQSPPFIDSAAERQRRNQEFRAAKEIVLTNTIPVEDTDLNGILVRVLGPHSNLLIPKRIESVLNDTGLLFTIILANIVHAETDTAN